MTANQRSINGLRYYAQISLIIPNDLDIRRKRMVSIQVPMQVQSTYNLLLRM